MKMFHWPQASCIKNYSHGDIIILARHVEEARELARTYGKDWLLLNRSWWFQIDGTVDPDEKDYYDQWLSELEDDLAKKPDERTTIFISGGE